MLVFLIQEYKATRLEDRRLFTTVTSSGSLNVYHWHVLISYMYTYYTWLRQRRDKAKKHYNYLGLGMVCLFSVVLSRRFYDYD
jgi:surface polysaccharide O-acyltransferase-like enzyme